MTDKIRERLIAGNWKMYKTVSEAVDYIQALRPLVANSQAKIYLAVPYTAIHAAAEAAKESSIVIGAQNMNDASEGAFTGEISGKMLADAGAKFVILGHSERRQIFGETSAYINRKVKRALQDGLQPVVCVGESAEQRASKATEVVVKGQLLESLEGLTAEQLQHIVLAYEPVWAIGTGVTATPEEAQQMHHFCRATVTEKWGQEAADKILILYGGSVKRENAAAILQESDIDGLLVGGASLKPEVFQQIVNA